MEIVKTPDFQNFLQKLPKEIKELYSQQENRFKRDWRDPRLHVKKVQDLVFALSFRITRSYRVFFYFQNSETAVFFEVDHRQDVYR